MADVKISGMTPAASAATADRYEIENSLVTYSVTGAQIATMVLANGGYTQGSILFSGVSGEITQDNATLFWNDTTNSMGIGTATPNAQAILELRSDSKAFVPPRLSTIERDTNITSPIAGMEIYNLTTNKPNYYNGTIWAESDDIPTFTQGSVIFADSSGDLSENNSNFYWDNTTTTLTIGDNHGINGTVTDAFLVGNQNTVTNDDSSALFGQGNISKTGVRNFLHGSSNLMDTCTQSAIFGSTSVKFTNAGNSGAIGSISCQNNGFNNSVFLGASNCQSNANFGIIGGQNSNQAHASSFIWGDNNVSTFATVAANKWHIRAANGMVLTDTNTVVHEASAVMDLISITKGFLKPRVTNAQMNAIVSPATGLEVFNTDQVNDYFYNGSAWVPSGGGSTTAGTVTTNWSGPFAAPVAGNIDYVLDSGFVTLQIPLVQDSATSAAAIAATALLPVAIRPAQLQQGLYLVTDNASDALGSYSISSGGQITFYADIAGNNFSGVGTAGVSSATISYKI